MDREASFLIGCLLLAADCANAAHPLITEDTGTQGEGRYQLELSGESFRDRGPAETVRGVKAKAELTYGAAETTDLQLTVPYLHETRSGGSTQGLQDSAFSLKWRFQQLDGLGFAVKPGITLPTGSDERGLGSGRLTWGLDLIGSYRRDKWEFHTHAGYRRNRNTLGERESLVHASGALMWSVSSKLQLIADLSRDTNRDPVSSVPVREAVYGLRYALAPDLGVSLGMRKGYSEPANDRSWLAGVTFGW